MDKDSSRLLSDMVEVLSGQKETVLGYIKDIKENTETSLRSIDSARQDAEVSLSSNREQLEHIVKDILLNIKEDHETTQHVDRENSQRKQSNNDVVIFENDEMEKIWSYKLTRERSCFPRRQQDRKEFKRMLIQHHLKRNCILQVSPLLQEEDAPLLDLYVSPDMKILEHHSIQSKDVSVTSYYDVFFKNNRECKNIYITGDAGIGKTSFCQKMVLAWCFKPRNRSFLCFPKRSEKQTFFSDRDLEVMKSFEYLFYISLRDTNFCHVEDILLQQLNHGCSKAFLHSLLKKSKCLIIMDGLDEWNHPADKTTCPPGAKVPHRQAYPDCTFVTTSRASKLDVIRLGTSEIDQQVSINGIGTEQFETLVQKVVTVLNSKLNRNNTPEVFITIMKKTNLLDLSQIPIVVMQLICQWYDKENSLNTHKSIVYGNTLKMLFIRSNTLNRHQLKSLSEMTPTFPQRWKTISVLQHLGQFAYATLFSEAANNLDLVFDYDDTDQNQNALNKEDMTILLSAGIISRNKVPTKLTERKFKLQFMHKSFKEFVTAVYIAMEPEKSQEVVNFFSKVSDFLEFSNVLVFLASICPGVIQQLNKELLKLLCKDERFVECRKLHFQGFYSYKSNIKYNRYRECLASLHSLQSLLVICARESKIADYPDITVQFTDIFIDNETQFKNPDFKRLLKPQTVLSLSTCCVIEEFVENETSVEKNVNKDQQGKTFTERSSRHNPVTPAGHQDSTKLTMENLLKLYAEGKCSEYYVSNLANYTHLQCLVIRLCTLTSRLDLHRLKELRSLSLFQVELDDQNQQCEISIISDYLQTHTTLTQISLVNVHCKEHTKESTPGKNVTLELSKHTNLITLELRRVPIIIKHVNTNALEACIIETDDEVPASFISCLESAPKLDCLTIYLKPRESRKNRCLVIEKSLTKVIPTLVCLRNILLVNVDFGNEVITFSPRMKALEHIQLRRNILSVRSLQSMIDTLPLSLNEIDMELTSCNVLPDLNILNHENQLKEFHLKLKSYTRFKITSYISFEKQKISVQIRPVNDSTNL